MKPILSLKSKRSPDNFKVLTQTIPAKGKLDDTQNTKSTMIIILLNP